MINPSFRLKRSGTEKSQSIEGDFSTPLRSARNDEDGRC